MGTKFTFTLNEPAVVSFVFARQVRGRKVGGRCVAPSARNSGRRPCARSVAAGALSFSAQRGVRSLAFQGRLSRTRALPPGSYIVVLTAVNAAGQRSPPRRLAFTIVG